MYVHIAQVQDFMRERGIPRGFAIETLNIETFFNSILQRSGFLCLGLYVLHPVVHVVVKAMFSEIF